MNQHAKVKIAILRSLKRMPKTYTMRDEALRAEVCLDVQPRPTLLELEDALTDLEQSSCIIGTRNKLTVDDHGCRNTTAWTDMTIPDAIVTIASMAFSLTALYLFIKYR